MEGRGRGHFLRGSITQSPFHDCKGPGAPRRHQERTGAIHQTQGGGRQAGGGTSRAGWNPAEPPRPLEGCSARNECTATFFPKFRAVLGKTPSNTHRPYAEPSCPVPCRASAPLPALAVPQPHRPSGLDPGGRTSRRPSTAIRRRRSHSGWGGAGRPGAPPVLPCFALPCSAWPCYPANIPTPWIPVPMHAVFRSCKLSSFFSCVRFSFPAGCHPFCPTRIPEDAFLLPAQGSSYNLNFSTLSWRC